MKKSFTIVVPVPKTRKPVQTKANSAMKSKKDYRRKDRNNRKHQEQE